MTACHLSGIEYTGRQAFLGGEGRKDSCVAHRGGTTGMELVGLAAADTPRGHCLGLCLCLMEPPTSWACQSRLDGAGKLFPCSGLRRSLQSRVRELLFTAAAWASLVAGAELPWYGIPHPPR